MKLTLRDGCKFIVIAVLSFPSSEVFSYHNNLEPISVVQGFCDAEFNGVRDIRFKFTKNSPARIKKIIKKDPELEGKVVFWDADTIFVVSTFSVNGVIQEKGKVIVPVVYDIILATHGDGVRTRTFVKNCTARRLVKYNLTNQAGEWRIYDPPLPYISLGALIKYYRNEVRSIPRDAKNAKKYTDVQRSAFKKLEEALTFLERVSGEKDYCANTVPIK